MKALFKVVQDLEVHNIALMIVMSECGVMALLIQVRVWHHMCLLYHATKFHIMTSESRFSFSVQICDYNYTHSLPNLQKDNSQSSWQVNPMQKTYHARNEPIQGFLSPFVQEEMAYPVLPKLSYCQPQRLPYALPYSNLWLNLPTSFCSLFEQSLSPQCITQQKFGFSLVPWCDCEAIFYVHISWHLTSFQKGLAVENALKTNCVHLACLYLQCVFITDWHVKAALSFPDNPFSTATVYAVVVENVPQCL